MHTKLSISIIAHHPFNARLPPECLTVGYWNHSFSLLKTIIKTLAGLLCSRHCEGRRVAVLRKSLLNKRQLVKTISQCPSSSCTRTSRHPILSGTGLLDLNRFVPGERRDECHSLAGLEQHRFETCRHKPERQHVRVQVAPRLSATRIGGAQCIGCIVRLGLTEQCTTVQVTRNFVGTRATAAAAFKALRSRAPVATTREIKI